MASLICVWGSPGVGATTATIEMAKQISKTQKNVAVVCDDLIAPTLPIIYPQSTQKIGTSKVKSIGKVLLGIDVSKNDILRQMEMVPRLKNLVFLGYGYGENKNSYPAPNENDIFGFYQKLSDLVDVIIVDCSSNLDSLLTKIALQCADQIVRCCECSFKSISYFASNLSLVSTSSIALNDHIILYPCVKKDDSVSEVSAVLGNSDYEIGYNSDIEKLQQNGELLISEYPVQYKKSMSKLVKELSLIG